MKIDKNKFNPNLPCNMEPFAFIEKITEIKTKNAGRLSIISFGALDYNNHYSPEFGGVALVHHNPDLLIAMKHVAWDTKGREEEHRVAVSFLTDNLNIEPDAITTKFYHEFDYFLPYMFEKKKREYLQNICLDRNQLLNQTKEQYENKELKEALEEIERSNTATPKTDLGPAAPKAEIKETKSNDGYLDGEKLI
ncbi:MAG: hypothetical protein D4S01_10390 [Dehalococcoidia bacterium]|nr:MAG: hypothetical protein D4S01_10390 [Dehalococcoidia bacterium]